jgi:hypothetical protein
MKRKVLISTNDYAQHIDTVCASALATPTSTLRNGVTVNTAKFVFHWENSESALEVSQKLPVLQTAKIAAQMSNFVAITEGLPLKVIPLERNF